MDPQLHTHAVVANVTQRADGRWVALESKPLYEDQKLGGMIYRAELAADAQRLGYAVEKTARDGGFELSAVPKSLIETFSTRREYIRPRGYRTTLAATILQTLIRLTAPVLP